MTSDPTSEVTGGRYSKKPLFTYCFYTGPATDPSYGLQINSIALKSLNGLDLTSEAAGGHNPYVCTSVCLQYKSTVLDIGS